MAKSNLGSRNQRLWGKIKTWQQKGKEVGRLSEYRSNAQVASSEKDAFEKLRSVVRVGSVAGE